MGGSCPDVTDQSSGRLISCQDGRLATLTFLPQVEQRLNAANPEAPRDKQRLFAFKVVDRDAFDIRLEHPEGRAISGNLSLKDLFTFDAVPGERLRMNFERQFQRYEGDVEALTTSLLDKLADGNSDVGSEIVNLFAAKLLNFTRNPFSVSKILDTFGILANYEPAKPAARQVFERVLNGRKPNQTRLCAHLGISDADYARWLRMLFMLFVDSGEGELTMLDSIVKSLFEKKDLAVAVLVGTYSQARCLMSDRSFSQTTDRQDQAGFDFNLRYNAFIRYLFADVNGIAPRNAPQELIEAYKKLERPVELHHRVDDLDLLRSFNRNAVYQCHSRVYCSAKDSILF